MQFFPATSKSFLPEMRSESRMEHFPSAVATGTVQSIEINTPFTESNINTLFFKKLIKEAQKPQSASPSKTALLSFIEEGRTDYTGLPTGFSAHIIEGGTLTRDTVELFKAKLRSKNVQELSIEGINQFVASGAPLQVSMLLSTLSGNTRITPELTEEERITFRQFMGTLHAHQDETDTMLAHADAGKQQPLLTAFMQKAMDVASDSITVSKKEISALLKGLDLSSKSSTHILERFKDQEALSVSKYELTQLLNSAKQEIQLRNEAANHAASVMRTTMVETLKDAKIKKYSDPVADIRGNQRSDQLQILMQDSNLKKTGLRALFTSSKEEANSQKDSISNIHTQANGESSFEEKNMPSSQEKSYTMTQNNEEKYGFSNNKASKADNHALIFNKEAPSQLNTKLIYETNGFSVAASQKEGDPSHFQTSYAKHSPSSSIQEMLPQIETAIAQSKSTGNNQMSLQLSSEGLGQLTLLLHVRNGEVRALIRADQQESALLLSEQLENIKASLEERGLTLSEFKVQANISDNNSSNGWNNTDPHNQMQDAQEQERNARLATLRLATGQTEKSHEPEQHEHNAHGSSLHIVT